MNAFHCLKRRIATAAIISEKIISPTALPQRDAHSYQSFAQIFGSTSSGASGAASGSVIFSSGSGTHSISIDWKEKLGLISATAKRVVLTRFSAISLIFSGFLSERLILT